MKPHRAEFDSPWPHRWAVVLACATFPLIWVGGLVTTYDAGMAVPDWPNTYGYNLFLYPWQTWIYGPWELFIEHGHRLLGSAVGMLTIGLLVSAWWCRARRVVRWLSIVALVAVIVQGILGGARVIEDQIQLAKIHGCFGPAFFTLAVSLAAMTSRRWQRGQLSMSPRLSRVERLAAVTTGLAYVQLVLGSQLRHLPADGSPGDFRATVVLHLAVAAALLVHVVLLAVAALGDYPERDWIRRPAAGLAVLICVQLALGAATWVTKYGWPSWFGNFEWAAGYTVLANSRPQAWIATGHVAAGSLILATSMLVALRAARLTGHLQKVAVNVPGTLAMEAAP
jgi:heme a synthase